MNSSSPSKEVMPGGDAVRPLSYSSTSLPRAIHVGCLDCSDTLVIARQDESMEGMEDLLSGFKVAVYGNLSSDSEKIDCLGKQVWLTSKTLNYDVPYFPTEHLRYIAYIITEYDNLGEFTLFVSKPRHDRKDIKSVKRIWAAKDVIKKCSDYFRLVGQGPQKSGSSLFKAVSDYFRVNWLDFLQPYLGWAVHRNVIRALGLSFWRSLYDRLAASSIYSPFVDSSSGLQVGQIMEHDWWQLLSGVCRSKLPQVSGTDTTPSRRRGDALAQAETTPNGASRSTKSWTNVGDALFGPTSRRCSDVSKKQREERINSRPPRPGGRCGPKNGGGGCPAGIPCCNMKSGWCGGTRLHCPAPLGHCPKGECEILDASYVRKEVDFKYSSSALPRAKYLGCTHCTNVTLMVTRQAEDVEWMKDLLPNYRIAVYGSPSKDTKAAECLGKDIWLTVDNLNHNVPNIATEHLRYIAYVLTEYNNLAEVTFFMHAHIYDNNNGAMRGKKFTTDIWLDATSECGQYFWHLGAGDHIKVSATNANMNDVIKAADEWSTRHWAEFFEPYMGKKPKEFFIYQVAEWAVHRDAITALPLVFWRRLYDHLAGSGLYSPGADSAGAAHNRVQIGQIIEQLWWLIWSTVCRSRRGSTTTS